MDSKKIEELKLFVEACKNSPQILYMPELKFFRDFIESFGGTIPTPKNASTEKESPSAPGASEEPKMEETEPEEESEESEVELDTDGVLEPEDIDMPGLGDCSKMVSEDDEVSASEKRTEAMSAMGEGDLEKAVNLFTEAIKINPGSAGLYAKRANILLKQNRIKAALRDCDEAIKLNPDSAPARKYRGRAHRLLGQWVEAARDLRMACRLDFDEQADEWLKEVQPNATKLEEHKRKYERKREEKEVEEKLERIKKVQEEHKKAQEKEKKNSTSFPGGMPGGMPFDMGAGGGPDGGMPNMGDLFNDPDILAAMQDPEVAAAFQDVSSNPSNILKYQSNPKVSAVINKLMKKFGGAGMPGGMPGGGMPEGMPGGFPGGMPGGMPGGFPKPPSSGDDLD